MSNKESRMYAFVVEGHPFDYCAACHEKLLATSEVAPLHKDSSFRCQHNQESYCSECDTIFNRQLTDL